MLGGSHARFEDLLVDRAFIVSDYKTVIDDKTIEMRVLFLMSLELLILKHTI
jgi:hypothetical protein